MGQTLKSLFGYYEKREKRLWFIREMNKRLQRRSVQGSLETPFLLCYNPVAQGLSEHSKCLYQK